jgi:hypothetical protein
VSVASYRSLKGPGGAKSRFCGFAVALWFFGISVRRVHTLQNRSNIDHYLLQQSALPV